MAMKDILDHQADGIEYILRSHGIKAHIDGGKLSPRLAHFHAVLPPGVRATQLAALVPEIAQELGVVSCRLSHGEEGVYLEVPRPDPVPVRLLSIVQRVADVVPPVTATLGLDSEGTPLLLRLNAPDVNPLLVVGNRGAGKSSLLGGIALSLALHNSPDRVRLLPVDCTGEGRAFRGLERLPHLACPVANGPVEAMLSLRWALRTLSRRAQAQDPFRLGDEDELTFDDSDVENEPFSGPLAPKRDEPSLVVLLDGVETLCGGGRKWAEAVTALNRLLAEGGRHNIHLVVSAENLAASGGLEADWGARVVGQVSSVEAARQATGLKGTGAQGLLGMGDFLVSLNTDLIRFQAAGVSSAEISKAVDLIVACAQTQTEAQPDSIEYEPALPARRQERVLEEPLPFRRTWVGK